MARREPRSEHPPDVPPPDPGTAENLERILQSPSFRRADRDPALLERDELRGVRLHLEYLKPELALRAQGVRHTIVVFGSTRILDGERARLLVEAERRRAAAAPDDPRCARDLAVAERLLERSHYYEEARRFGRLVSEAGRGAGDDRLVVVTGGGPGLMEAANRGAREAGAVSVGLNILLPREQEPNPWLSPDVSFLFRYFALRKMHFVLRARALVAFPGGYGTMDELFETLTLVQTGKIEPIPVVLVGREYWERAVDFQFLADSGTIDEAHLELFELADTAPEIWERILGWYQRNGRSLFGGPEFTERE